MSRYHLDISIRSIKRGEDEEKVHTNEETCNGIGELFETMDYYGSLIEGANDEGLLAEGQMTVTNEETGEESVYYVNQLGHIELLEGVEL